MRHPLITLVSSLILLIFLGGCDSSTEPAAQDNLSVDNNLVITENTGTTTASADEVGNLTEAEILGILFMREEEKLARDVYLSLFDIWQDPVFNNIASSEQRHMDSMLRLLQSYGLDDPALDDIGAFFDSDLQALYDELMNRGMQSNIEALMVGALIEEVDMRDIQQAIDEALQADVISTYESLLCGSRNHLRSFVDRIEALGVIYRAQVLSQDEVDAIVNSSTETDCGQ